MSETTPTKAHKKAPTSSPTPTRHTQAAKKTISSSQEDYLESILYLLTKNTVVRVTDLAIEMKLSKPSVHRAISNLKAQGLVEQERYGSITLTHNGECLARSVQMRHDIIKRFLTDVLEVPADKADDEACNMEHNISLDTILRLSNFVEDWQKQKQQSLD